MKFTFIAAILAVLTGSRWGAKAADHHADADVDAMVSHRRDDSEAVLSNAQDDRRALGSKSSKQQPKRLREKAPKSSKQQPKSSKADAEQSSKFDGELCIWSEKSEIDVGHIKENTALVIESVNEAKSSLNEPTVLVVVPKGVTEERTDRVSMISEMASDLGEDESTFTILEEQEFEVPDGDVVVVHLACGAVPTIVTYKNGVEQTEQGVFLLGKNGNPSPPTPPRRIIDGTSPAKSPMTRRHY